MPSLSSVRLAGRCDCSTILMISSFSDAGYAVAFAQIGDVERARELLANLRGNALGIYLAAK